MTKSKTPLRPTAGGRFTRVKSTGELTAEPKPTTAEAPASETAAETAEAEASTKASTGKKGS